MAFGDGGDDAMLAAAWGRFCDQLKDAGALAFKDRNPAEPLTRADAFRFLTQNVGQAFDLALETRDAAYPQLHAFCGPNRKLGGDCADFTYHQAWIDGASTYRITGDPGTARFLNLTVQGPRPVRMANGAPPLHEPFGDVPEANMFGHQLVREPDGGVEIVVGGPERSGNWLPTTPGSRKLFLRQGFDGWDETPAAFHIERIGMDSPRPLPMPATMAEAMAWAGDFLSDMMSDWPDWPFAHGGVDEAKVNAFPAPPNDGADRKRGRAAAAMHWALAPDEALVVEFDAHDGLWMLTNAGPFMNSMDYAYRPVSFTPSRTRIDDDGRVRVIIAHDDTGHANWMDTQGFPRGNLTYRHMMEGEPVPIETRLVKRADLASALPAGTALATPDERIAAMRARFGGIRRRYPV